MNLLSRLINEKTTNMEQINQNNKNMKGKYLLGALFMAVIGAFIALFVYTRLIDKPSEGW